ncbi:hypothetical protein ACJ41O_001320 [Fusarium nematophilum]
MGRTVTSTARIEINAPPATVRSIFLDFSQYNKWQQGWDVRLVDANKTSPELQVGDVLRVSMVGMVFHPSVLQNTPDCFAWEGSVPFIVSGKHYFLFSPSEKNPGGTTFLQKEDFTGTVATLFGSWFEKEEDAPNKNWDAFNAALKKEAERVASAS